MCTPRWPSCMHTAHPPELCQASPMHSAAALPEAHRVCCSTSHQEDDDWAQPLAPCTENLLSCRLEHCVAVAHNVQQVLVHLVPASHNIKWPRVSHSPPTLPRRAAAHTHISCTTGDMTEERRSPDGAPTVLCLGAAPLSEAAASARAGVMT